MKKIFNVFAAFVLIVSTILMVPGIGGKVSAAEPINGLDSITVSYADANGILQTAIKDDTTKIKIRYNFKFPDTGNGESTTFQLPSDLFQNPEPQPETDLMHGQSKVGTYEIDNAGNVTFTFLPNQQNVEAWFEVLTWIDPKAKWDSNTKTVELASGKSIELKADFADKDKKSGTISGRTITWTLDVNTALEDLANAKIDDVLDSDLTLDTNSIKVYPLDVSADGTLTPKTALASPNTTGSNGSTLKVDLGAIKGAYRIEFKTTIKQGTLDKKFTNTAQFNSKSLKSNEVDYKPMVDLKKSVLTPQNAVPSNTSTATHNNTIEWEIIVNEAGEIIPAGSVLRDTVSKVSGQEPLSFIVDPTINVQRLVNGNWESVTDNSVAFKATPPTTAGGSVTTEIEFKNDTTDTYRIVYKTDDNAVASFYGNSRNIVKNTVGLYNQENTLISNEPTPWYYYTRTPNDKLMYKALKDIDYQNQLVTSVITVQVPTGNTEPLSIFDWAGGKYDLTNSTVTINKYPETASIGEVDNGFGYKYWGVTDESTPTTLIENTNYHVTRPETTNQMYVYLYGKDNKQATPPGVYEITIVSPFAADSVAQDSDDYNRMHNNSWLRDGNNKYISPQIGYDYKFNNNPFMSNNGFKNGTYDYDNREITWEVGFNYNIRSLAGATVTDTITGNHVLDKSSFQLELWRIGVPYEGDKAGKDYTESRTVLDIPQSVWDDAVSDTQLVTAEGTATQFTIDMDKVLAAVTAPEGMTIADKNEEAYIITYKTKMENNLIDQPKYQNDFKVDYQNSNPNLAESTITGTADVAHGGEHVEKRGSTLGRYATWTLDINAAQSYVKDIEVTDKLSDNQILLAESIAVYPATLNPANLTAPLVPGDTPLNESAYEVFVNGNELTVKINGEINEPYVVKYQSYITAADGEKITNKASVTGQQLNELQDGKESLYSKPFAAASAGASAIQTDLIKVTKTAAHTQLPLKDVQFTVSYELEGKQEKTIIVTDANGEAVTPRLPVGTEVIITETQTNPGFVLDTKGKTLTIGSDKETNFINQPETNVTLTKRDSVTEDPLAGAEFKLQKKDGTVYKDVDASGQFITEDDAPIFTTSSDPETLGQITFDNLPVGEYQFVEVKAPEGYDITPNQDLTFNLNAENLTVKVDVTNEKQPDPTGTITLTKEDADDSNVKLDGAVFKLQKEGTNGYEDVLDEDGKLVTYTTSNGGTFTTTLDFGKYQFVEVTAPEGYDLDETPYKFELSVTTVAATVTAYNKQTPAPLTGTLTLTKVDADEPLKRLAGAEFKLQQLVEDAYVDVAGQTNLVTDANGQIIVMDLPLGKYQFIETKAPAGYDLDETPIAMELSATQLSDAQQASNKLTPKKPGSLEIVKVDGVDTSKPLAGAEFDLILADGTTKKVGPTDASGKATIVDVPVGTHQLKETKAPEGYVLNTNALSITVTEGEKTTQTVTNFAEPQPVGAFELLKVDATTKAALSGAEFMLSNESIAYKIGPTDANGVAKLSNIPVGTYTLTEVTAPAGYEMKTKEIVVTIAKDTTTPLTVENVKLPPPAPTTGELKIIKVDAANKATKLAGATFTISDGVTTKEVTTNNEGEATLTGLTVGTYVVTETKAPTGYILNNTPQTVRVEAGKTATLTFENTKQPAPQPTTGDLKIIKVDAGNKAFVLPGAVFTVTDGDMTKMVTTNSAGEVILTGLTPGAYVITELQAPTGYVLNSTPRTVKVEAGKTATFTFENVKEVELGNLQVTKVDSTNSNTKLAGAQFDLIAADGKVLKVGPTDANGVAKLNNIPVGTYQLKETVAPTGYTLSTEEVTVAIGKGATASVTVRNDKVIPKTGIFRLTKVDAADSSIRLGGATFTLTNGDKTHTVVTDVSGLGLVTDLEPGNYILTETVAPTGYVLNEKSVIVKIVANEVTEHTFSNTKKPVTPNPNPNGEDPNNGTNPDSGTNPKPNPNGENPNSGTNPDSGTKPKDPNSLTPNTGTKPSTGTNTGKTPIVTPNNTGGTSGTNTTNKKPTLPQTNGESTMVYTLLGLLLVAGSTAILIARRRKTN